MPHLPLPPVESSPLPFTRDQIEHLLLADDTNNGNGGSPHFTRWCQNRLLLNFSQHGVISRALEHSGVSLRRHQTWLEKDPSYYALFIEARESWVGVVDTEVHRRAITGVLKPVFYKGEKVALVREYSDSLLTLIYKGLHPTVNRHEITTPDGQPIRHVHEHEHKLLPVDVLSPETLSMIERDYRAAGLLGGKDNEDNENVLELTGESP